MAAAAVEMQPDALTQAFQLQRPNAFGFVPLDPLFCPCPAGGGGGGGGVGTFCHCFSLPGRSTFCPDIVIFP